MLSHEKIGFILNYASSIMLNVVIVFLTVLGVAKSVRQAREVKMKSLAYVLLRDGTFDFFRAVRVMSIQNISIKV